MPSPSARLIGAAHAETEVVDSEGRRLAIRRLGALDKLRLFKAAGASLSYNQPWMGMAVLAASVTAIDDVPVPPPATEGQIEALVSRLADHGLAAVASVLTLADPVPGATDERAHAKN